MIQMRLSGDQYLSAYAVTTETGMMQSPHEVLMGNEKSYDYAEVRYYDCEGFEGWIQPDLQLDEKMSEGKCALTEEYVWKKR